jgi:hypothetical protein
MDMMVPVSTGDKMLLYGGDSTNFNSTHCSIDAEVPVSTGDMVQCGHNGTIFS